MTTPENPTPEAQSPEPVIDQQLVADTMEKLAAMPAEEMGQALAQSGHMLLTLTSIAGQDATLTYNNDAGGLSGLVIIMSQDPVRMQRVLDLINQMNVEQNVTAVEGTVAMGGEAPAPEGAADDQA